MALGRSGDAARLGAHALARGAASAAPSEHQVIGHKLADLATSAYAARCVTYDALRRFVAGEEPISR